MSLDIEPSTDAGLPPIVVIDRQSGGRHSGGMLSPISRLNELERLAGVGLMTAGIVHDLGNLLQIIEAGLRGMQGRFTDDTCPDLRYLHGEVCGAARRASSVTHRVLDHARGAGKAPGLIDIGAVVVGLKPLIGWAAGPEIRVRFEFEVDLPPVECDPTDLENAVINLVVNARHAMPEGGVLQISAIGVPGGISLQARDTGCGMSEAAARGACEHFVSGRPSGSGLGLAIIADMMRRIGGALAVDSSPGRGTAITLRFVSRQGAEVE